METPIELHIGEKASCDITSATFLLNTHITFLVNITANTTMRPFLKSLFHQAYDTERLIFLSEACYLVFDAASQGKVS
jgi:hypothetical protein